MLPNRSIKMSEVKIMESKLSEFKEALPQIEQNLDKEFYTMPEEFMIQYKQFKEEYFRLKYKEYNNISRILDEIKIKIQKRENALRRITNTLGTKITESEKEKFFNIKAPHPIVFSQYEINVKKEKILDIVNKIICEVKERLITDINLDHIAAGPYKRFKSDEYYYNRENTTIE